METVHKRAIVDDVERMFEHGLFAGIIECYEENASGSDSRKKPVERAAAWLSIDTRNDGDER